MMTMSTAAATYSGIVIYYVYLCLSARRVHIVVMTQKRSNPLYIWNKCVTFSHAVVNARRRLALFFHVYVQYLLVWFASAHIVYTARVSQPNAVVSLRTHSFAQSFYSIHLAHSQTILRTRLKVREQCNTYSSCIVCDNQSLNYTQQNRIYVLSLNEGHFLYLINQLFRFFFLFILSTFSIICK